MPSEVLWSVISKEWRARFDEAQAAALSYARDENPEIAEVSRRLLWATQDEYADVFCWLIGKYAYPPMWAGSTTIVDRLEFIRYFVGYELLDDGDPGIAWVRYGRWPDEEDQLVWCEPNHPQGWRVITHCRESVCADYYLDARVDPEKVIQVIEEHEAREVERVRLMQELELTTDEDVQRAFALDPWTQAIRDWMAEEDILPSHINSGR